MNISDHPLQLLEANALTLRTHNSNLSKSYSRRLACELDPRTAKAAGLTTEAAITAFANAKEPVAESQFANANSPQAEARRSIAFRAEDRRSSSRCSYADAVRTICSINPGLARQAGLGSQTAQVAFANEMDGSVSGLKPQPVQRAGMPANTEPLAPLTGARQFEQSDKTINGLDLSEILSLGLCNDATKEEYSAAKSAGSKNLTAIWRKMVDTYARDNNVSDDVATGYVAGRFPRLNQAAVKVGLVKGIQIRSGNGVSRSI